MVTQRVHPRGSRPAQGEQETEALKAMLHDPDFQAKRFAEIPELVARLDADKAKVAKLYTRWEELEAIREAAGA